MTPTAAVADAEYVSDSQTDSANRVGQHGWIDRRGAHNRVETEVRGLSSELSFETHPRVESHFVKRKVG